MSEQMIPVSQYLIQSCIEQLELALENQVVRHCGDYICDGYGNMSPQERWKKWGLIGTYDTWEELNKLVKEYE